MAQTQTQVIIQGRDGLLSTSVKENLSIVRDAPVPQPGEGEALVKLLLSPIHPYDLHQIASAHGGDGKPPKPLPFVPGIEGLGEVVQNTGAFKKGQRVVAMPWPAGAWQQYTVVPEKGLIAVPDGVSDEAASQYFANPLSALGLVEDAAVPKGQYLLQTAAGSVLGRMVIALAKRRGVKTVNVVRRSAQRQELLDIGADEVIATDEEDLVARVQELTGGEGAYTALDAVAGPGFQQVLSCVRKGGCVISYGILSSSQITLDIMPLLRDAKKVHGFTLFDWLMREGEEGAKKRMHSMWDLFLDGTIQPLTGNKYPLEGVFEAIEETQKVARGGKVLLHC